KHEMVAVTSGTTDGVRNSTDSYIKQATKHLDDHGLPWLHGFSPIPAPLNREAGKVPPMVYRSSWALHARVAKPVPREELKPGDVCWEAPSNWSLQKMLGDPKHLAALNQWLGIYFGGRARPQIIFENSVIGTLSTDNQRVYTVEDFQVPPYTAQNRFGQPGG